MCSAPLSSRALLNDDFLENLTKAVPLDLPSSLVSSLTSRTFPHSLKKSLISLSYAWKESPLTQISKDPSSSAGFSSSMGSTFLGAGLAATGLAAGFLATGFYYSLSSLDSFLAAGLKAFLGAGFSSDYYSDDSG